MWQCLYTLTYVVYFDTGWGISGCVRFGLRNATPSWEINSLCGNRRPSGMQQKRVYSYFITKSNSSGNTEVCDVHSQCTCINYVHM